MKELNKKELIIYEMPWIADFISIEWIQDIIATYVARKVSKKNKLYNARLKRQRFVNSFMNKEQTE